MNMKMTVAALALAGAGIAFAGAALAEGVTLSVTNVVSRQRYPWNGLVDIDCEILCSDAKTNVNLYLSARDNEANRSLPMRHVWIEGDATRTNALTVKAGKHRLVWDAGADAPNTVSGDVTIDVQALVGTGNYLVIDLSGGPSAASYPVSYLGAEPQGGWTDEHKTDKLVLRLIQPGTFTMGSPEGEVGRRDDDDEYSEKQHAVTLTKPFYMGVFEVTQRQWELVMGSNPSYYKGNVRPVEYVSYDMIRGSSLGAKWPASGEVDATSFIGKIRAKTGLDEFDLPTEAQWEYACRAGTTTALNSGKNLTSMSSDANMNEVGRNSSNRYDGKGGYSQHTTVGSYRPNDWGLYDMHGNVWEWCLDWWTSNLAAATDPVGASSGSHRVMRGGGWLYDALGCRSAYRDDYHPPYVDDYYGFRLCCPAGLQGSLPSGK